MDDDTLKLLSKNFNRTKAQVQFLLGLCDNDFDTYFLVEEKIKNNFLFTCPMNKKGIKEVLEMDDQWPFFKVLSWNHQDSSKTYRVYKQDSFNNTFTQRGKDMVLWTGKNK